ncbi:dUTP diphosphatase protein [Bacillus phage PK2]|nr:dUTP diphosphatase protein [Bacillus phage PK2]
MRQIPVKIKKLHKDAVVPFYAKQGDAGFDLVTTEKVTIPPHSYGKAPLGLAFELPEGYELQIRNRSGVTSKSWIRVQLGTVDSGYRGEVSVMIDNPSDFPVTIEKGFRIAQGVVNELPNVRLVEVEELGQSERGAGGFGSTGTKVIDVTTKTDTQKEYLEIKEDN